MLQARPLTCSRSDLVQGLPARYFHLFQGRTQEFRSQTWFVASWPAGLYRLRQLPPVFATFKASVTVIDKTKREELARLLLDSITSTAPEEKLDEKLSTLMLTNEAADCE